MATNLTRDQIEERLASSRKAIARCDDAFLQKNLRAEITHLAGLLREIDTPDLTKTPWDRYGDEGAWFQIAGDDTEIHIVKEGDGFWVRHLDGEGGGAAPLDHKGPYPTLGAAVVVGDEWLARIDAANLQP